MISYHSSIALTTTIIIQTFASQGISGSSVLCTHAVQYHGSIFFTARSSHAGYKYCSSNAHFGCIHSTLWSILSLGLCIGAWLLFPNIAYLCLRWMLIWGVYVLRHLIPFIAFNIYSINTFSATNRSLVGLVYLHHCSLVYLTLPQWITTSIL